MDRGECVSLLPRVCEVLRDSGRSLPDDTSLEKLLDWFSGLTEAGGSLLEAHPCLLEFISTVVNKTSSDPDVISFALKLSGLIAATEDGFETLQVTSLFRSYNSRQTRVCLSPLLQIKRSPTSCSSFSRRCRQDATSTRASPPRKPTTITLPCSSRSQSTSRGRWYAEKKTRGSTRVGRFSNCWPCSWPGPRRPSGTSCSGRSQTHWRNW
uniref:BRCA1-associated ATM activator 1 n=1 Tax=Scophthalmus maximus TaxID=52904 RepID=A0A8D3ECC7_SCOMX